MSALSKILIGGAGVAALVGAAAPAAAQYYPSPYGYNNGGGVVGAIINAIGGGYGQYSYGNYGYGQNYSQAAVNQCSQAVEARLNGGYGYNQGYGYAQPYGYANRGYGYNNGYGGARIAGITRIERKSNGRLKIYGVAMSNAAYGNQAYGYGYQNRAAPDLRFNCKVDRYGRVTDVDVNRMAYNQNDYYYGYRRY
jgi:hypothetical protein